MDYSRVEPLLLKENFRFGLAFLEGYVFFRALRREVFPLIYDPTQEMADTNLRGIPGGTFRPKQRFGSTSLNLPNIFEIEKDFRIYQLFQGVSPSPTRVFYAVEGTDQKALEKAIWGTGDNYRFGFYDGFLSPLTSPAPETEIFVTRGIEYTWAVFNPLRRPISPIWSFIVNRMAVAVIRDVDLIMGMLNDRIPVRLAPIGGLAPPRYNMVEKWRVNPVELGATREEVAAAVAGA